MNKVRFYDLLGIPTDLPRPTRDAEAAAMWPQSRIRSYTGMSSGGDSADLVRYLQDALEFQALRPGSDLGQVGLTAEVVIKNPLGNNVPIVFAQMPDIAFYLQNTPINRPARLYVTYTEGQGLDLVIEGLPVEVQVPVNILESLVTEEVTLTDQFKPGDYDSLQVILGDTQHSSILVHVKIIVTQEWDIIIEPAVPISIGPCRFIGLPCQSLHDLNLIPSLKLQADLPLEWTRHRIDSLTVDSTYSGAITARTIDLDITRPPLKELTGIFNQNSGIAQNLVEFVLEDVAMPFFNLTGLPIPSHGQFGLRRKIEFGDSQEEAFSLSNTPARINIGDWLLLIDQLFLRTPASLSDQFIFLQMALLYGEDKEDSWPLTIGVTDDWTVQAGMKRVAAGLHLFTIADAAVSLWGFKVGWSIKRFASEDPITQEPYPWTEQLQLLVDLGVTTKGTSIGLFKMRSLSGKDLEFVLRDVGWNLGSMSLEGLNFPEGAQLLFGNTIRLIVEEFGWITENNGGRYFSFTGGVEGLTVVRGIRFHRLRFKTGGNPGSPSWLLDGLTLSLKLGRFSITGYGMVAEFDLDGHEYKEFGFGIQLKFSAIGKDFLIGMQLFQGEVSGPVDNFTYWMFGFQFSPIPLGAFELVNIRMLMAGNMIPSLPPPDGYAQNMRIFRWYKATESKAITILSNRKLTGWTRRDDSFAAGLGAGLSLPVGEIIRFDSFLFFYKSPEDSGLMIALEAYLLAGDRPVGYGVIEFDFDQDRWGFMIGVDVRIDNLTGFSIPLFSNVFSLSGTLYAGNKPGTFAIGQLNDQSSWLSLRLDVDAFVNLHLYVGLCVQLVDLPDGPRGFGIVMAGKGGADFGIGSVKVYATFGIIAGVWKNESNIGGFKMWLEAGLQIKVFWIFNFGASIKIDFDYLGPNPIYRRLGFEIEIGLPFPFPDVTFRFEKVWGQPMPSDVSIISTPVIASDAINPRTRTQQKLKVTPLTGSSIIEQQLFTMNQLRGFGDPSIPSDIFNQVIEVGIDSMIALNFKPPVDDKLANGETTPFGAGTQKSVPPAINDLKATYELVEVGIRRRPHFGPAAGIWTTLLAPENTRIGNLSDLQGDSGFEARFASKIIFQWDRDILCENRLDPRRLLINASTPYTFLTGNPEADENFAINEPGWPCCRKVAETFDLWHELNFKDLPTGIRVPSHQVFSYGSSTLHWSSAKPPLVVPAWITPTNWHVARIAIQDGEVLAIIIFDEPAFVFELYSYWNPLEANIRFTVEAYNGLELVGQETFHMIDINPPQPITFQSVEGMTSIRICLEEDAQPIDFDRSMTKPRFLEIFRLRYRTVQEELEKQSRHRKCEARNDRILGGGKFSWLPNHDYEITITTNILQGHTTTGPQEAIVKQKAFFRTKGIIGLNAVSRVGDEVEGYVESRYPESDLPIVYRSEPVGLAFNEQFNILLPVDRAPSPDNPDELNQILEWVLTVREEGGAADTGEHISKTAPDWILAHRRPGLPIVSQRSVLANSVVRSVIREAITLDPFMIRLENMAQISSSCNLQGPNLYHSQVLLHEPVDLDKGEAIKLWARSTIYQVNMRRKDGPFVYRSPFQDGDETAFNFIDEDRDTYREWRIDNNSLHIVFEIVEIDFDVRRYAIFGEGNWNHVQIHTTVDNEGGAAGVAIGVAGVSNLTRAVIVLVDEVTRTLRILERRETTVSLLESKPLPEGIMAPYSLEVIAFDDKIRAKVHDTLIEVPRNDIREGRLALVNQGGGTFSSLVVEPVDAYRFSFQSSMFSSFEEHIQSFNGEVSELPMGIAAQPSGITETVDSVLAATLAEISTVMIADADPEARQRVFDKWTTALALPLHGQIFGVKLTRISSNVGTPLLLLESPEPIPLSKDVTLAMKKRTFIHHPTPVPTSDTKIKGSLLELASGLDFVGQTVTGSFESKEISRHLRKGGTWLVRSEKVNEGIQYHIYKLNVKRVGAASFQITGEITETVLSGKRGNASTLIRGLDGIKENEFAIMDNLGHLITTDFIPVNPVRYFDVPFRVLTNGNETRALIIPIIESTNTSRILKPGTYRFDFNLDRARFRNQSQDDVSNYRASASILVEW